MRWATVFGVLAPPKVAITYDWPGTVRANGAIVATARAAASSLAADQIPDRIVVGYSIRLHHDPNSVEPGENPELTTLGEEGCPDLTSEQLIETLSKHLLAAIDGWQNDGLENYLRMWHLRLENIGDNAQLEFNDKQISGTLKGLDDHGNLLVEEGGGPGKKISLVDQFVLFEDVVSSS